jgi:hypothetical protein
MRSSLPPSVPTKGFPLTTNIDILFRRLTNKKTPAQKPDAKK